MEIAGRYGLNGDEVLDNILLARAYTHEQQMDVITAAAAKIVEDNSPYHLLVLFVFTPQIGGRLDHRAVPSGLQRTRRTRRAPAEARQTLECFEKTWKWGNGVRDSGEIVAEEFNVAVVIINQVTADPGAAAMVEMGKRNEG